MTTYPDNDGNGYRWDVDLRQWVPAYGNMSPAEMAETEAFRGRYLSAANVLGYGADPTGVADSSAAFLAAWAASDVVFVPEGTFRVVDPNALKLDLRKVLYGTGIRTSVINFDGDPGDVAVTISSNDNRLHGLGITITDDHAGCVEVVANGTNGHFNRGWDLLLSNRESTGGGVADQFGLRITGSDAQGVYFNRFHDVECLDVAVGIWCYSTGTSNGANANAFSACHTYRVPTAYRCTAHCDGNYFMDCASDFSTDGLHWDCDGEHNFMIGRSELGGSGARTIVFGANSAYNCYVGHGNNSTADSDSGTGNLSIRPGQLALRPGLVSTGLGVWHTSDTVGPTAAAHTLLGRAYYAKVFFPRLVPVTQLGWNVTTAGTSGNVVRLGLFADRDGRPGRVLRQGTVAGDSTGEKPLAVTSVLVQGTVWIGVCPQGAGAAGSGYFGNHPAGSISTGSATLQLANVLSGPGSVFSTLGATLGTEFADNPTITVETTGGRTPFVGLKVT